MGEAVSDDNYHSIILGSLPTSYDMFLTSITNQISPLSYNLMMEATIISGFAIPKREVTISPPKVSPDNLMEVIGQEADRQAIKGEPGFKPRTRGRGYWPQAKKFLWNPHFYVIYYHI
jgi:hypothetical protein